jgi:hypothetical protein
MKISLRKSVFPIIHRQWKKTKLFVFAFRAAGAGHAGECGGICKKEFRKIFDFPPMQNGRNKVKYLIEN